jgi:hypothetical protein
MTIPGCQGWHRKGECRGAVPTLQRLLRPKPKLCIPKQRAVCSPNGPLGGQHGGLSVRLGPQTLPMEIDVPQPRSHPFWCPNIQAARCLHGHLGESVSRAMKSEPWQRWEHGAGGGCAPGHLVGRWRDLGGNIALCSLPCLLHLPVWGPLVGRGRE